MAMAAGNGGKLTSDLTDCSICLSTWNNPRSLPGCDHTFCLECLKTYGEDFDEGDHMSCPLCRKEFTVPKGGLDALKTHFMAQQLLDARKAGQQASSGSTSPSQHSPPMLCELCTTGERATDYCVHCNQDLCHSCSKIHLRTRAMKGHKVITLAEKQDGKLLRRVQSSLCEQHEDEQLKLWCEDCEQSLCTICHATAHVGHKCADIKRAGQTFADKITGYLPTVDECITVIQNKLKQLVCDRSSFMSSISEKEHKIEERREELEERIEEEHRQLRNELNQFMEMRLKEMKTKEDEIETQLVSLQGFMNKSKELVAGGLDVEICRLAGSLCAEADNLIMSQTESHTSQQQRQVNVTFSAATMPDISGYEIHAIGVLLYAIAHNEASQQQRAVDKKKINLNDLYEKLRKDMYNLQESHVQAMATLKKQLDDVTKLKDKHAQVSVESNETAKLKDKHTQSVSDQETAGRT